MSNFEKIRLYPNNTELRLLSYIFIIQILAFIWLSFDSYLTGEIRSIFNNTVKDETSSTIIAFTSLLIVCSSLLFAFLNKIKRSYLTSVFLTFIIYVILQTIFTINVDNIYIISICLSALLWLFIYWGCYGIFYGIHYNLLKINRYINVAYIYCAILFIYNYLISRGIGLRNFHYIEINYLITLMPFIAFLKKKNKIIIFLTTAILVFLSAKRASMVTFVVLLLVYVIYNERDFKRKFKSIIGLVVLASICIASLAIIFPENFEFFVSRFAEIENDGGSGRDEVYESLYYSLFDQDLISLLFGRGYNYVQTSELNNGLSAHNDFLETIYDYGLVGFIIFVVIIFKVIRLITNRYLTREEKVSGKLSIIIFIILSMISHMTLHTTYVIWLIAFWAYLDVISYKRQQQLK